jgi:hypothetical protein
VAWLAIAGGVAATDVWAVRIDGTTLEGTWVASPDAAHFRLQTADGVQSIPIDDLARLVFKVTDARAPSPVPAPDGVTPREASAPEASQSDGIHAVFYPADGGRLHGRLLEPANQADAVLTRSVLGASVALGFDHLAGVRLGPPHVEAAGVFDAALAERLPGEDVLVTRDAEGTRRLGGRLVELGPKGGSFVFGGRTRSFKTEKLYGVVFAAGIPSGLSEPFSVTVTLADGSVLPGRVQDAQVDQLRLATSLGPLVALPFEDVVSVDVRSRRVAYVSDLPVYDERVEGRLHRAESGEPLWPVRQDRAVGGGPLSMAGQVFSKGLGVHSFTELTFDIGGAYETFVATIGLDDAVRPRGHVVFRILGDDQVLFDSGAVTGQDEPREIKVDVSAVGVLKLVVDYGDGLDLADHADWGNARLLRPPADARKADRDTDAS